MKQKRYFEGISIGNSAETYKETKMSKQFLLVEDDADWFTVGSKECVEKELIAIEEESEGKARMAAGKFHVYEVGAELKFKVSHVVSWDTKAKKSGKQA